VLEEAQPTHLVLSIGHRRFRVALSSVEGVAIAPEINPVPGTPPSLPGLVNLRGTIVPALEVDPEARGERRHLVLFASREFGRFALLCDWIEQVAAGELDAEQLDPDELARRVVAEYASADQRLPIVERPAAGVLVRADAPDYR
jgi:chemotaxis signal transduction protein